MFICPSRHKVTAYPWPSALTFLNIETPTLPALIGRSDYAANAGSVAGLAATPVEDLTSLGTASDLNKLYALYDAFDWSTVDGTSLNPDATMKRANGVIFRRSTVPMASIRDGLGCTYLVGERHMDPQNYISDDSGYDNSGGWDMGYSYDVNRWTVSPPYLDHTPSRDSGDTFRPTFAKSFGSAHSVGFHMAFCDGSVRRIALRHRPGGPQEPRQPQRRQSSNQGR